MAFPAGLLLQLRKLVPGFADEVLRDQLSLARMLWMSTQVRREHVEYEGMLSLSKADIRRLWGSDSRMRKVVCWKYFTALRGSNLGMGFTNAYRPTTEMQQVLDQCLADSSDVDWLDEAGRVVGSIPRAIAAMSADGKQHTKWSGVSPANSVHIDVVSLWALRCELDTETVCLRGIVDGDESTRLETDNDLRAAAIRRQAIDVLIKLTKNKVCPGATPIRYVEQSTGRLFAEGVSLQSVPREVRNAALAGCWDYDISNCHWALINQLAARHGLNCGAIQYYLDNKHEVREAIASGAGITVQEAKDCLLMIMFGAPASLFKGAAIPQAIGKQAARRLYELAVFRMLHADVKSARAVIVANLLVQRGGWVKNALGLRIKRKTPPKNLLAHILQGVEAQALKAVVETHGTNVLLCVHDGWVTRDRLVVTELERTISAATGLDVKVEEKRLEPFTPEDLLLNAPRIKIENHTETQHLCGFPEEFGPTLASSSPEGGSAPGSAVATRCGASLMLTERPRWNWPKQWGGLAGSAVVRGGQVVRKGRFPPSEWQRDA